MLLEKTFQQVPAIVKDKNESLRLEMGRYHPMLVQNLCHIKSERRFVCNFA